MSFAIITDSTSDISPARAQELGIYVIPLHVIIEGEDLLDQVQITAEEYVARMAGSEQLPHTSQPSAGEFNAPTATIARSLSRYAASGPPAMPTHA